jgi:Uncharacterized conserved protein
MRRIVVFSREKITNYGDPIIADCVKYILEKLAAEHGIKVEVEIRDIYSKNLRSLEVCLNNADAIVFPGGGVNSTAFNELIVNILDMVASRDDVEVYFNAIGINRKRATAKNEALLVDIFSRKQVRQITTRGDLNRLCSHLILAEKEYVNNPTLVIDPAIWSNEAYGVSRKDSEIVGVGLIRPDIFRDNGSKFEPSDVLDIYRGIIEELDRRGIEWRLFTNGMAKDYDFGIELLGELGRDKSKYLGKNIGSSAELVEKISQFKGIIAARMHANIIATSLGVPSIGLVWNDKMNLFAECIDCQNRYVSGSKLQDPELIVSKLERALIEGYNLEQIENMKNLTIKTLLNILGVDDMRHSRLRSLGRFFR